MKKQALLQSGLVLVASLFIGMFAHADSTALSTLPLEVQLIATAEDGRVVDKDASCICRGGPNGNYTYQCKPVAKQCYGGPGNYPYTCYVCPQT